MIIKSHAGDYGSLSCYLSPEKISEAATSPETWEDYSLYHTAHCYVSERHAKGDLLKLVYVLLKQISALKELAAVERQYGELRYEEATASIVPPETMKAAEKRVQKARAGLAALGEYNAK